jgi:hypothetical protein
VNGYATPYIEALANRPPIEKAARALAEADRGCDDDYWLYDEDVEIVLRETGAMSIIEKYAEDFCELGKYHECCGRMIEDECSGCAARAFLRATQIMCEQRDFEAHLASQLGFLERSARGFDEGHTDEALRIATALRVIFRQTPKTTSLLTHLGAPNVLIRSTVPDTNSMFPGMPPLEEMEDVYFVSMATPTISDKGELRPKLEEQDSDRMIPADKWWDEVFSCFDRKSHRRSGLVLAACEKDGGAHVDADLPAGYAAIKAPGAIGTIYYGGGWNEIENAHLVFLRSMAFEVLHSPELRKLAGI